MFIMVGVPTKAERPYDQSDSCTLRNAGIYDISPGYPDEEDDYTDLLPKHTPEDILAITNELLSERAAATGTNSA